MATSQDSSQGKRAAHFSSSSTSDEAEKRPRREATPHSSAHGSRSHAQSSTAAARPSAASGQQMSERTARATERAAKAHKRRAQGAAPAKKSSGVPVVAILALVLVFAVVGIGFLVVPRLFQHKTEAASSEYPTGEEVIVTIPDGAGGIQIASILLENHVISSESAFYQEVQKQNADATMKSGTYQFITGANVTEVVRQLVSGPNATQFQLTVPEGKTVKQTAELVETQLGIPSSSFIEQAKASNYVNDYSFLDGVSSEYDTLEGYLFPKKYDMGGSDMSADAVIRAMLNQYEAEVGSIDFGPYREAIRDRYNVDISNYGIIKLASVIEKEAVTDEDRPLIASVFYNRLGRNFPGLGYVRPYLESDATMMYETGGEVTASDLQTDSPYNSYLNQNLPPTPICSPSLASIQAALEPADTDYFYFFINENVHQFSETYEEHQQAINESLNS
ncbi:MAG: endolytic transglycosylase MltG [Atopobiaceae bacterium]|nr:endolytic transglycosylase MltG [Atopobiaceae bacterium]